MKRDCAIRILDKLHKAQNQFYAGGAVAPLQDLLDPGISSIVPGPMPSLAPIMAPDAVLSYFRKRRDIADHTFRLRRRDVLVGNGHRVAALTHGSPRSARSITAGPRSASTRSSRGELPHAGCSRSTSRPSTPSGPSEPTRQFRS